MHGLAGAMAVAVSPDGRHVYVSAGRFGGDDAVIVFRLAGHGRLAVIQEFLDGGGELQGFLGGNELAVSPDGLNAIEILLARFGVRGQDMTLQEVCGASLPLSFPAVGAWINRSNRSKWSNRSGSYGGVCAPRSRFVTGGVLGSQLKPGVLCLSGSFPSASVEAKEFRQPCARESRKTVRLKKCW